MNNPPNIVCPPGLDCIYAFTCPSFVMPCPDGFICSSYSSMTDQNLLKVADKNYLSYKFSKNDIFSENQIENGRYIQSSCIKGFYCPDNSTILPCPSGSWCPEGSTQPIKCDFLSICPRLSYFQINFVNAVIMVILTVIISIFSFYLIVSQKSKERSTRNYVDLSAGVELSNISPGSKLIGSVDRNHGIEFNFSEICKSSPQDASFYLLNQISGRIEAGSMTGILGPSGCGKSTLISVLRTGGLFASSGTVEGIIV